MNKIILTLSLFLLTNYSHATDWVYITSAQGAGTELLVKVGSFDFSKVKGSYAAVVTGKMVDTYTSKTTVLKWQVPIEGCINKTGLITSTTVKGKYILDSKFVFGGKDVSSKIAEFICDVAEYTIKEKFNVGVRI